MLDWFSDHYRDAALRGVTDTLQLLGQQQYELGRRMADLKPRA
jgi:hypothetical protein